MYSKEERKAIHTAYWNRFRSFVSSMRSSSGRKTNWLNYPTRLKEIHVRLDVNNQRARFSVDIQSTDEGVRALIWEQFLELRKVFEKEMKTPGVWSAKEFNTAGQEICSIYWDLNDVNMYEPKDEKKVFGFFRERLKNFDRFYEEYNEILFGLIN
ncbi:MAG: DUF4268 domain-containing protein [Brumimicrobium sp.]|nr:DUF4268 domain-containing protein [Brumimicrobium sp.]